MVSRSLILVIDRAPRPKTWLLVRLFQHHVGRLTRLLDIAKQGLTEDAKAEYNGLDAKASECTKCGACMSRCPSSVDIISNMEKATSLFQ